MKRGVCVEKLPHSCGTASGLQVFLQEDGSYDGYCFSCGKYVPDPYKDKPEGYTPVVAKKTKEEIDEEIKHIISLLSHPLPSRKLRKETLEHFNVKVGVSPMDGSTPDIVFFPYTDEGGQLTAYKARILKDKRMWAIGSLKGASFFGWKQAITAGAKTLYITEGEIDAMSLYQMLRDSVANTQYKHLIPAVVSLPSGAGSVQKAVLQHANKIRQLFEKVVYVPDMDEPGQKAAEEFVRIFPGGHVAELPCKDVNDCLLEGKVAECLQATKWKTVVPKNTRIVKGSTLKEKARTKPEYGRPWPWLGLTKATRGRRLGETFYFGAGTKMGKSEVVDSIAKHCIVDDGLPTLIAKPEQANVRTYQNLVGKAAGRRFNDPNIPFDEEAYDRAEPLIGDKALLIDVYQFMTWDTLKDDIRYAVVGEGVKDVIIDPITCFTNTMKVADANEFLTCMSAELSAMALQLGFIPYCFCHLKAPQGNNAIPHERGGKVLSTQFAGSRAMMRSCNYMIGIEGNKDPDLPEEERNLRSLIILEDREFGCSDRIHLYWNNKTGLFTEV
jgi:twinkle protein